MVASTMWAVQVRGYGGVQELQLAQIPVPEPQPGEVLVRVYAAGVLPADVKQRQGFFRALRPANFPYTPGSAMAGVVAAVGPGVTTFRRGQAILGRSTGGTYAEYAVTAAEPPALTPTTFSILTPKPETLHFAAAATISAGATTAWTALFDDAVLHAEQRVLIQGAAGGVGAFAVQFARWKGAEVIGTSSAANVEFVRSLGATTVVDYTATPFEQVAQGVDVVLDTVGGETLRRSMGVVRRGGTLISLVEEPSRDVAAQRGIHATMNATLPTREHLLAITQMIAAGDVRTTVGQTFPLREVRQAQALVEMGHGRGRVVLEIANEAHGE